MVIITYNLWNIKNVTLIWGIKKGLTLYILITSQKGVMAMNEVNYPATTRAEMIRQARESCSKKMNEPVRHTKQKRMETSKHTEDKPYYLQKKYDLEMDALNLTPSRPFHCKSTIVRFVVAVVICFTVITIDQLGFENEYISGDNIEEWVESNVTVDELEQMVSDLVKDKVYPVFQQE